MVATRTIARVVEAKEQSEGDGARVRRSVGGPELRNMDPFLLLDEFRVRPPAGFPNHPHRGFETVTYMLEGKFKHKDNKGHEGEIGPGDLQWMTAGSGLVHSEMPATDSDNVGLQLWVNLPKKKKMMAPNYQELLASEVPIVHRDGVHVKVIAGRSIEDVEAKVLTQSPILYVDITMDPGAQVDHPIPKGYRGFAYVLSGKATFADERYGVHGDCLLMEDNDEEDSVLRITADTSNGARLVIIAGVPLKEPVVQYGPFVMNTREEIMQAFSDYQANKF